MKKPDTALKIIKALAKAASKLKRGEESVLFLYECDADRIIRRARRFLSRRKKAGRK